MLLPMESSIDGMPEVVLSVYPRIFVIGRSAAARNSQPVGRDEIPEYSTNPTTLSRCELVQRGEIRSFWTGNMSCW